jgi:hypothetical protein
MEARMRTRAKTLRARGAAVPRQTPAEVSPTAATPRDKDAPSAVPHASRAGRKIAPDSAPPSIRPLTPRQVAARLAGLNCDPLAILAELAKNTDVDPLLRAALARHLAAYQIAQLPEEGAGKGMKPLPSLGEVIADGWRKPSRQRLRRSPKAKSDDGAA